MFVDTRRKIHPITQFMVSGIGFAKEPCRDMERRPYLKIVRFPCTEALASGFMLR